MVIHRNPGRNALCSGSFACLGLWLLVAGVVRADQVVLFVDGVPEHGLVVKRVDFTAALKACQIGRVEPAQITATNQHGAPVPFEFIPAPDFEPKRNATGTMVARLRPDCANCLKLEFAAKAEQWPDLPDSIETPFYTVVHSPENGGMPSKITFRETGKVFENFRWQDRVHHEKLGGFTVRNDYAASVECIASGPLCTTMRVRAKYVDSAGKPPRSNPEATYYWIYLHELPLVLVTAQVRQNEPFQWSELHFLELNFPGEDFKGWAGGEPSREGLFKATGKSHHTSKWGALVDGPNVIAMFDCGQTIFHDGRGSYGTYLHAHGDRAWQSWSGTQTQFSAWLWIGSSNNALAEMRRFLDQSPGTANVVVTTADTHAAIMSPGQEQESKWRRAMARQLEAAGRFEEAVDVAQGRLLSNWTLVEAGDLNLLLERTAKGVNVLSLFDTTAAQELLSAHTLPLFSLIVRDSKTKELSTITADSGWHKLDISRSDAAEGYELSFSRPIDDRLGGISVEMELQANKTDNGVRWDIRIINDNRRWGLWHVVFPQVSVRYLGEGAKVFLPHTAGIEVSDIWNTPQRKGGTYPSGWTCMQYMAAYNTTTRTGLYVGVHDPFGSTKDIFGEGHPDKHAVTFSFEHPVANMGKPGAGFDLPGEARWQLLRGDWFDAAQVYRIWASQEARWWPALGPEGRGDTPEWMRTLPAWAITGGSAPECVPRVTAFAKALGTPTGFHWYNWHQIPFDNDYPHYFPPKDKFRDGVTELKMAGVYPMPYINGRLWDTHDKGAEDWQFSRIALAAATKDEQGNPYTESYGSKETDGNSVKLAAMCPATSLWQNQVRDIVLRLFNEYGVTGVYIDQIAAAQPRLCFDASHGHDLGGGQWWTEGYWTMLNAIRSAKPADCMLTTECNAEPYIKWFDGYLTWHWQEQNMVPAFPAVYGGTIQMFGRAYRGGPSQDLAHRMKAGQQLVFGEQIGWLNPEVIDRPDCGKFLRDCIQLRWQLKEYFHRGHMARPPKLAGQIPTVTADWQWRGEWPITTDAIMTGAWQIQEEKKVVFLFANVSDSPFTSHVEFDPGQYGLSDKALTAVMIRPNGMKAKFVIPAAGQPEIELAARDVLAWEIGPVRVD